MMGLPLNFLTTEPRCAMVAGGALYLRIVLQGRPDTGLTEKAGCESKEENEKTIATRRCGTVTTLAHSTTFESECWIDVPATAAVACESFTQHYTQPG